jgi:serine/threonine-protein phosphatase 4 regulatory subunit 1
MHELAPRLGHDLCRSFVALELAAFADDSTFRVRKATAASFGNVCDMVGESFTVTKLLPCYVRLSKDLIWGVRASCAKSLVAVTRVVGVSTRTETIIPMFKRFASDSSRWVRNGAYEILGPFLHALGPGLVSKELVAYYANIPTMSSAIVDQEVNYHAAFNLPAVLTTIGRDRWDELLPCFSALMKDQKYPVRRTLAYSLHELAALLGPDLTEASLLPALDSFLRDLDEVRYGVLKNFALILRCISPTKRVAYLEVLWMVQRQNENWRWRLLWAKQLGAFAKLFSAETTVTDIMPLTFAQIKSRQSDERQRRRSVHWNRTDRNRFQSAPLHS